VNSSPAKITIEAESALFVSIAQYVVAKSLMVVPVLYIMSIFALVIPGLLVNDQPAEHFGQASLLWAIFMFCFECLAECLSGKAPSVAASLPRLLLPRVTGKAEPHGPYRNDSLGRGSNFWDAAVHELLV
jgi:hypothetical protein